MDERSVAAKLIVSVEILRFEAAITRAIVTALASDAAPAFRQLAIAMVRRNTERFRAAITLPPDEVDLFLHETTNVASAYISLLSEPPPDP